ncbi:MAG: hypothetical protein JJLCMIEE_03214 [Acidimicrobiales bacterium]|nr:hypothetical protein [Acidimicrobiales bacterium]
MVVVVVGAPVVVGAAVGWGAAVVGRSGVVTEPSSVCEELTVEASLPAVSPAPEPVAQPNDTARDAAASSPVTDRCTSPTLWAGSGLRTAAGGNPGGRHYSLVVATRKLIIAALIAGLAILVAFAVLVLVSY